MRKKRLTENTCRHAWVVLGKALSDAERRGLVVRNVARLVDPPSPGKFEVDPPDWTVIGEIIHHCPDEMRPIIEFMARTGVRRGEAVALRWSSVDWDHRVAAIIESAQRLFDGRVEIGPPKTSSGRRPIALDAETLGSLTKHRAHQEERILGLGSTYGDQGFVFAGPFGKVLVPDKVSRTFRKAVRESGNKRIRLQDLRHAHVTELMAAGVYPKVVQERLGHSTVAFTLDRYSRVAAAMQHEALSSLHRDSTGQTS